MGRGEQVTKKVGFKAAKDGLRRFLERGFRLDCPVHHYVDHSPKPRFLLIKILISRRS
jgi:hypothetical protein